jgi:DNA-binding GntR family transcriptional regulator
MTSFGADASGVRLVPGVRLTAHQMVRESLRRAILDGSLPAGSRLVQADIAADLNVSTTPVREALRDLSMEGLIKLDAHRGAVVHGADLSQVKEIYLLRRLLEPEAVRIAARSMTDETLAELEAMQEQMDAESDTARWVELNRQFHRELVSASRMPRLVEILHQLEDNATVYVNLAFRATDGGFFAPGNHDHHELIDACRRHDGKRAAKIIVEHLASTLAVVEDSYKQRDQTER